MRPAEQEALLRLTVKESESTKVVLWSGPRREIWEEGKTDYWPVVERMLSGRVL